MLLLVKMKSEAVCERSQTRARAGLGVNGIIDKFIYKQQFSRRGFIGNIQGDSRKFLGHFKCHFGQQISSESLKQI